MKPEQLGSFYAAAASFYRQAPWKQIGYESALRIECDRVQSGPWYVVVMGLSGLTIGLALYEDLEALEHMWRTNDEDEETARATAGTSVTFEEEWDLPVADVEAIRRHGWEIARPDAYPVVFHKERGLAMRPPLVWELELLDGCLRTIPDFIRRRRQDDPTRETMTVQVGAGPMTLVLSWVPQDDVAAS